MKASVPYEIPTLIMAEDYGEFEAIQRHLSINLKTAKVEDLGQDWQDVIGCWVAIVYFGDLNNSINQDFIKQTREDYGMDDAKVERKT